MLYFQNVIGFAILEYLKNNGVCSTKFVSDPVNDYLISSEELEAVQTEQTPCVQRSSQ